MRHTIALCLLVLLVVIVTAIASTIWGHYLAAEMVTGALLFGAGLLLGLLLGVRPWSA